MSRLTKRRIRIANSGSINTLLLPLILATLLLIGAVGFGYWAFASRQDYKNNVDQKVATAVQAAKQQQTSIDAASSAQAAKYPLNTYTGPEAYGSIVVEYPKTWSGYVAVATQTDGSTPLNAYFQPGVVPNIADPTSLYALRVEIVQSSYSDVVQSFNELVQNKQVVVTPYSLPKVPSVVGVRIDGEIEPNKQGSMVILPLRDTTLQIWTEVASEETDFNNNILQNFSFSP